MADACWIPHLRTSIGGISIHGNFDSSQDRLCTSPNFRDAAEDRRIEVTRAALVAYADGHILQDDKLPLLAQGLAINAPFQNGTPTVFARKIIHTLKNI
jgi:hypothetical protein